MRRSHKRPYFFVYILMKKDYIKNPGSLEKKSCKGRGLLPFDWSVVLLNEIFCLYQHFLFGAGFPGGSFVCCVSHDGAQTSIAVTRDILQRSPTIGQIDYNQKKNISYTNTMFTYILGK